MRIIDISMPISEDMILFEGDPKVKITSVENFPKDSVKLSKIQMGLHSGTHIESPAHFLEKGKSIDEIGLKTSIGNARVCDMTSVRESINIADLKKCKIRRGEIVLLKTRNSKLIKRKRFSRKFVYLSDEGADYLVQKKVRVVGIDYLSIEKFGSKDGYVHKRLLSNAIPIIEGVNLEAVKAGTYTLFCLPLKVTGVEAAPARCILIE